MAYGDGWPIEIPVSWETSLCFSFQCDFLRFFIFDHPWERFLFSKILVLEIFISSA